MFNLTDEKKKALIEFIKEVLRWTVLFVFSWFVAETLKQADLIPVSYSLKVWVFTYIIPIKTLFIAGLTGLGRLIDRLLHESGVAEKGLLPF